MRTSYRDSTLNTQHSLTHGQPLKKLLKNAL